MVRRLRGRLEGCCESGSWRLEKRLSGKILWFPDGGWAVGGRQNRLGGVNRHLDRDRGGGGVHPSPPSSAYNACALLPATGRTLSQPPFGLLLRPRGVPRDDLEAAEVTAARAVLEKAEEQDAIERMARALARHYAEMNGRRDPAALKVPAASALAWNAQKVRGVEFASFLF